MFLYIGTIIRNETCMKTLILNIDRDDDFGRKAKVKSPIIGLEQNIDAAHKLGCADPEDSDLNAIFLAIATYQELKKDGADYEVATICGDINVGIKSDKILVQQLEQVIAETKPTDVIVISDGAEDEYILPLIQSRLPISSIKRVSVKQSRELEDTYYRIMKLINDDKVKKQLIFPVALLLLVGAVFVVLHLVTVGIGAILFTLGVYLLIRVFNMEKRIAVGWDEMKSGFFAAKISFYTSIVSLIIIGVTVFYAWTMTRQEIGGDFFLFLLAFLKTIVWGIVAAGLIYTLGKFLDIYVREKQVMWSYWIVPFSLFAFGFISYAVFDALYISLHNDFSIEPFFTLTFVSFMVTGIVLAFIGTITYHYIKDVHQLTSQEVTIKGNMSRVP